MKAKVSITQKTLYTNYQGNPDEYSDTLNLEFDNLEAAKSAVDAFPVEAIENIDVDIVVTLKDYDKRESVEDAEDGEGE